MPYLHLTLGHPLPAAQQQALARRCTDLLNTLLGKRREVTAVRIELTDDAWFIAGTPLPDGQSPCHGLICITAETNSHEEKADFLAALHALLEENCGPLPLASYLVIQEIPASSWGYGGLTQAARLTTTKTL